MQQVSKKFIYKNCLISASFFHHRPSLFCFLVVLICQSALHGFHGCFCCFCVKLTYRGNSISYVDRVKKEYGFSLKQIKDKGRNWGQTAGPDAWLCFNSVWVTSAGNVASALQAESYTTGCWWLPNVFGRTGNRTSLQEPLQDRHPAGRLHSNQKMLFRAWESWV